MKVFIETYGCQMNVNDSEVALSILQKAGYERCETMDAADLILINTCSVRDNAEQRVLGRLDVFRQEKRRRSGVVVGVMGCMAERLKEKLLENPAVDIVAGPDAYRDLPRLVAAVTSTGKQINTILSHEETYGDISPVRMDREGVTAFISIMRGCNNVCSYCIVPFVRGAERSRDPQSIVREARELIAAGYKEINLLGQNVDSYHWVDSESGENVDFAGLLEKVALLDPKIRIRFATSHPKDMSDAVLLAMSRHANICRHIHLPVQSGSNMMLEKMNRKYTREHYLERIARIREILPDCAITTDVIAGFCGETETDHEATLSLMKEVRYDSAFMFQYSERPGTKASRHFPDDVPAEVKTRRLNEIIAQQNGISLESNERCVGQCYEVLVECVSKRSDAELMGRTSQNKSCVFPADGHKPGDTVTVRVLSCTSATLRCEIVEN
jgi:tRNA-2-methylthio-N6-dimethylallyladenosine synthase